MAITPLPDPDDGRSLPSSARVAVLAGVAAARRGREQAERDQVHRVLDWAVVHQVPDTDPDTDQAGAGDPGCVFVESCLTLAGRGAPRVGEYAAMELAAALGMATDAGQDYLGNALEVRYRLPRLWARLAAGEQGGLTVWRAFRIATQTRDLCPAGAAQVDARLAGYAHKIGAAQIDRTVADALAVHDPDTAARLAEDAADQRHFSVHLTGARPADRQGLRSVVGVVEVTGLLGLADALDLDTALTMGAARLADLGSTDTLDVRRSVAAGDLARTQLALDLPTDTTNDSTSDREDDTDADHRDHTGATAPRAARGVTIYAHLKPGTPLAELDQPGLTGTRTWVGLVKDWCQTAGSHVTVVPVIDLAANPTSTGYQPSGRVAMTVDLRDRRCVFPYCTRPARPVRSGCDRDHRINHDDGGPTSAHNMAPLCRRHHRAKTHSAWTYEPTPGAPPGLYTWTSPTGLRITVDPDGTHPTHTLDPPPRDRTA